MTRPLLLVLGASGQAASEAPAIGARLGFEVRRLGRAEADLTTASPAGVLDAFRPAAILNAAAYTAVDRAEDDEAAAFALNARMPGAFAAAAATRRTPFVHLSTDYVFDGSKPSAYLEDDPKAPLGVYGRSKAEGEDAVLAAGGPAAVMRTAWVYGAYGANFAKTMVRLAATRDEVAVVGDQIGCPTWSADVVEGAVRLARALMDGAEGGVFHGASAGEASWADFAAAIFEETAARGEPAARVRRIATSEYPTPAHRPANSRLAGDRLEAATGWRPGPWRERLRDFYATRAPPTGDPG